MVPNWTHSSSRRRTTARCFLPSIVDLTTGLRPSSAHPPFATRSHPSLPSDHYVPLLREVRLLRTTRLDKGLDLLTSGPFEGAAVVPSVGPGDSLLDLSIGGRLSLFADQWDITISDAWVRSTICFGLSLEFSSTPPKFFLRCSSSQDRIKSARLDSAIQHLLDIKAIDPVPSSEQTLGFYSRIFLVPKSSGGWRAILDLKSLTRHIVYRWFKMQSLQTILLGIRQGDFMSSIDLTEAYLHIPIQPAHRKFLHFCHNDRHFQYNLMNRLSWMLTLPLAFCRPMIFL